MGDSELPPAPVAGGSNPTASACSAIKKACNSILKDKSPQPSTSGRAGKCRNN